MKLEPLPQPPAVPRLPSKLNTAAKIEVPDVCIQSRRQAHMAHTRQRLNLTKRTVMPDLAQSLHMYHAQLPPAPTRPPLDVQATREGLLSLPPPPPPRTAYTTTAVERAT